MSRLELSNNIPLKISPVIVDHGGTSGISGFLSSGSATSPGSGPRAGAGRARIINSFL